MFDMWISTIGTAIEKKLPIFGVCLGVNSQAGTLGASCKNARSTEKEHHTQVINSSAQETLYSARSAGVAGASALERAGGRLAKAVQASAMFFALSLEVIR